MTTERMPATEQDVTGDDAITRLYLAIGRVHRSLRKGGGDMQGLGPGSVSALATLVGAGTIRLGDLAAREGVAPPTLSRMIAALVDAGYVAREPDPADGRASLVGPTELGRDMITQMRSSRMQELRKRMERLSGPQREALFAALEPFESLVRDCD